MVFVLFLPFDLIKAGATQTKTSLLKQNAAGERVDLLDDLGVVYLRIFFAHGLHPVAFVVSSFFLMYTFEI